MLKRRHRGRFQKRNRQEQRYYRLHREYVWSLNKMKYGEYTCEECGLFPLYRNESGETKYRDDLLTADHILERKDGGTDHYLNLRTTCAKCNNDRSNRLD